MTFKIGDKVRTTLEGDRYYNRVGVVKRGTLDAHPHEYYLVTFDELEGEWYQVDLLELADTTTDHTAAVIEAARAVLKHVTTEIQTRRSTGESWLRISFVRNGTEHIEIIEEGDDEPRDTLLTTLAGLRAAIDAYDEAETESDILSPESEG